jgi:hypothetical protein
VRRVLETIHPYSNTMISRHAYPICFSRLNTLIYSPDKKKGAMHVKICWQEGYGRINGGTWVLELAADNRGAMPRTGPRSTSTSAHEVDDHSSSGRGVELDTSSEEDYRGERSGTVLRR